MRVAEKWVYRSNKKGFKFYRRLLRLFFSCDIPSSVKIGDNMQLPHNGLGVVIHRNAVIGNNCKIYQNVTIGGNGKIIDGKTLTGAPILEDNVAVFAGACILGPIRVGEGSYIGANTVVTKDVPPNSLVYGNPAIFTTRKYDYDFS